MSIPLWYRHLEGLWRMSREDEERSICRAAAEISGLRPDEIVLVARSWEREFQDLMKNPLHSSIDAALRRFAALAQEKQG